ncbi:Aldo/keto reductase [Rhizodiscina lignyota]|uniref:Aldo/keto reductase n=1 Tax=Rhizodiscina lignyota TaxID=1504668 RepID=A0A9P4IIU9_9PEZI|nr:Aldo/keto reductase [Rhizodiscina lignyota]
MPQISKRQLGKDGPFVSAIGFGAMSLSYAYGKPGDDEARFAVLDRALELGATFWDSSDAYFDSEDLLKQWFDRTKRRDDVFLATKGGMVRDASGKLSVRSDPEYVKEACNRSLKRLGIKKIDLYYCHRVDPNVPIEHVVTALAELKAEGKIGAIGLSEISAATLRRACKVHPISAVQTEYSAFALDIEDPNIDLLRTCKELGVAVVAYGPLGRGLLTGHLTSRDQFEAGDFRIHAPRFSEENFPKNLELAETFKNCAERKHCTPGQVALAWLLAQGDNIIPIPGTKKIKYLEENMGALSVSLTESELEALRHDIEKVQVMGERYPEALAQYSFVDTVEL